MGRQLGSFELRLFSSTSPRGSDGNMVWVLKNSQQFLFPGQPVIGITSYL